MEAKVDDDTIEDKASNVSCNIKTPPPDIHPEETSSAVSENQHDAETTKTDQSDDTSETRNQYMSGSEVSEPGTSGERGPVSKSSPKVQFGTGTKERDGSVKGVKRMKRSFKDIVLKEVMKADPEDISSGAGTTPKSILKVRSEPALSDSQMSLSYVNKAYEGDSDGNASTARKPTSMSAFLKRASSTSSGEGHGFADVVDLLIQRTSLDSGGRDVHPFGRDCSIEGIMQASRPKSHSKNSAFSKLVIWMTLMSFLLGAAFGVIFLSEAYSAKQRADRLLKATMNSSST